MTRNAGRATRPQQLVLGRWPTSAILWQMWGTERKQRLQLLGFAFLLFLLLNLNALYRALLAGADALAASLAPRCLFDMHMAMMQEVHQPKHLQRAPGHASAARNAERCIDLNERGPVVPRKRKMEGPRYADRFDTGYHWMFPFNLDPR